MKHWRDAWWFLNQGKKANVQPYQVFPMPHHRLEPFMLSLDEVINAAQMVAGKEVVMVKHEAGRETVIKGKDRQGALLVNVSEKRELAYCARAIRIGEDELLKIVKTVGPSIQAILREAILKEIRDRGFLAEGR
ncbi:MAG TPA: DUF3606 domain-containing protein [Candidatus Aminicenantes bacterium]|nr:DUF3606 domain-containing protein [Candidatus Aminicenantes bacterium]